MKAIFLNLVYTKKFNDWGHPIINIDCNIDLTLQTGSNPLIYYCANDIDLSELKKLDEMFSSNSKKNYFVQLNISTPNRIINANYNMITKEIIW